MSLLGRLRRLWELSKPEEPGGFEWKPLREYREPHESERKAAFVPYEPIDPIKRITGDND